MSTTVKGAAQGSNTWKAYITYDIAETGQTATVTYEAGMMIESSGSTTRGFTATLSATGLDTRTGSIASGTTRKKNSYPILTGTYEFTKGATASTITVTNVLSATGTTATSTATFNFELTAAEGGSPKLKVKVEGNWVEGTPKVKVNGQWLEANKIYTKVNGTWVEIEG